MVETMDEKEFATRLARLRENKGVSARDMSLSIGQNPGYINNIETGKAKPSLDGFFYICEFLGITPSEFFDTQTSNPSKLDDIIKDMKKLNEKQLNIIDALVKDMIKH
jgi:transcriptional regulator with XRE-family HTH domain